MNNKTINQLETTIREKIKKDNNCTVEFIWSFHGTVKYLSDEVSSNTGYIRLDVITKNPNHNAKFLLKRIERNINEFMLCRFNKDTISEPYCSMLNDIIDYIKKIKNSTLYKVSWASYNNNGVTKINHSYFYENNIQNILEKIYECQDNGNREQIIVHEITLVPES